MVDSKQVLIIVFHDRTGYNGCMDKIYDKFDAATLPFVCGFFLGVFVMVVRFFV